MVYVRVDLHVNYYLGYEDQIKEVTEINLEKKEKNLLLNEVDE